MISLLAAETSGESSSSPARLLYVAGAMRSGSTALSLLLNQHSNFVAISQPEWLTGYAAQPNAFPCTCGCPIAQCPFWRAVAAELARTTQRPFDPAFNDSYFETSGSWELRVRERLAHVGVLASGSRSLLDAAAKWVQTISWNLHAAAENHLLFEAVRTVAGKSIVVDASKLPSRGKLLYMTSPEDTRILWLVRDGRAAAWSRMRRTGVSFEHATVAWLRAHAEVAGMMATVPGAHRLMVRYEDLCIDPARQLERICHFLDVPPGPSNRFLLKSTAHLAGGNEMRYRLQEEELVLDDMWKKHLTSFQLRRFNVLGGWLNRSFGYR